MLRPQFPYRSKIASQPFEQFYHPCRKLLHDQTSDRDISSERALFVDVGAFNGSGWGPEPEAWALEVSGTLLGLRVQESADGEGDSVLLLEGSLNLEGPNKPRGTGGLREREEAKDYLFSHA